MKKACVLVILFGFSTAVFSDTIGINFSGPGVGRVEMSSGDSAGATVSHSNWNNSLYDGGADVALNDNSGNATDVTISYENNQANGVDVISMDGRTDNGDNKLMSAFVEVPGADGLATFTINGLGSGAYEAYNVYVYLFAGGGNGQISDGTTTYYFSDTGTRDFDEKSDFVQATSTSSDNITAANYAVFSGSGTSPLVLSVENLNSKWNPQNGVHGIQIEAIPEPATLGLIALSACGALAIRRVFMI